MGSRNPVIGGGGDRFHERRVRSNLKIKPPPSQCFPTIVTPRLLHSRPFLMGCSIGPVTPNHIIAMPPSNPWKSPLQGFENADPLPTELNPDGKSLVNPPGNTKSPTYDQFPSPIDSSNNGFDFHSQLFHPKSFHSFTFFPVYYMPTNKVDADHARALHERIRREFPEVCYLL